MKHTEYKSDQMFQVLLKRHKSYPNKINLRHELHHDLIELEFYEGISGRVIINRIYLLL